VNVLEPVLPNIRKYAPISCCFCSGQATFGELYYEGESWVIPLAWHSAPHCKGYRAGPNTSEFVVDFARQCAQAALSKERKREGGAA
jgi:hypothetical protein